jgi:hypothetical protein
LVVRSVHQLSEAFPGRREDIEGDTSLLVGDGSVGNVRWNDVNVASTETTLLASELEVEGSFQDRAYLLLPVLVDGSDSSRLEVDEADVEALPEHGAHDDAGFNGQRRDILLDIEDEG